MTDKVERQTLQRSCIVTYLIRVSVIRGDQQSASICLAIDTCRFRITFRQRYGDSALAQFARHIRQIEINMFGGTCGYVAALQLTESSRPGDVSRFACYQKPISLVLPLYCQSAESGQSKQPAAHKPYSSSRVYYNRSLHNFFMAYICCVYDDCSWPPCSVPKCLAAYEKQSLFLRLSLQLRSRPPIKFIPCSGVFSSSIQRYL